MTYTLIDQTLVCTSSLPATPYPGFQVFNLDFKIAAEAMVRGGAAIKVAACNLQFGKTIFAGWLNIIKLY